MEQEVQKDIDRLINYAIDFAETLLHDYGEYYPFGARIDLIGRFIPVDFFEGDNHPESQVVINRLTTALEAALANRSIQAFCIAYDVRVTNERLSTPTDTILILIKHLKLARKLSYFYPYEIGVENKVRFLEPWAVYDEI